MSVTKLSVRLIGLFSEEMEQIIPHLGTQARLHRRGSVDILGQQRTFDVLSVPLYTMHQDTDQPAPEQVRFAIDTINQCQKLITTIVKTLDRAELYASARRTHDQGGFEIPATVLCAASAAGLSLSVSIIITLEDEE